MGESEVKVPDTEEVITALQSKAGEYKNAFADLKPIGSFKTENYSYHRMQQTYMGTPVFGRGVVYVSDKNGEEYLVTHNLEDIPENILTEFGLDEERTKAKIEAYLKENYPEGQWENLYDFALEPMYICIYNLNGPARFAYNMNLYGFNMVIDANNGDVLYAKPLLVPDKASFKESGSTLDVLKTQKGKYVLKDENTGVYIYTVQGGTYCESDNTLNTGLPILIESEDNIFGNEDDNMTKERILRAEEILNNINAADKFFTELAGEKLMENTVVIFDDATGDKTGHSTGGGYGYIGNWVDISLVPDYEKGKYMTSACIYLGEAYSQNPSLHIGTYAHEYTHALTEKLVSWAGSPNCEIDENGAIDEAIADIFGEIIESRITGTSPDWIIGDSYTVERNIKDPSSVGYPGSVYEALPAGISERHGASTIISHTAYNMYVGVNGGEKLSLEELSELWYNTLLTLPSDCDFVTLRKHTELAAQNMGLSKEKIKSVKEAFNEAGINSVYIYTDAPTEIKVYGKDNSLFKDYSATVEAYDSLFTSKMQFSYNYKSGEGLTIPSDGRLYKIRLDNTLNPIESFVFTVQTVNFAGDKLPEEMAVFSGFTKGEAEENEAAGEMADTEEVGYEIIRLELSDLDETGEAEGDYYYEYLKLSGNTPAIEKINALLYNKAADFISGYLDDSLSEYGGTGVYYSHVFTRVLYNADGYLNIEIVNNSYSGGLHDNTNVAHYLFDLSTGETVGLPELMGMEEEAALERIREITFEQAKLAYGETLDPGAETSINYWGMDVYNSFFFLQDGEVWLHLPTYALSYFASGSREVPTGILLGAESAPEAKLPSAGIIELSSLDSDLDGYTDDVDLNPYVPYKPPVIMLHGRISNTDTFFGVKNSIDKERNSEYGVNDESFYTSVENQKIISVEEGKLGEYLEKVLGYEANKNLFAFNYPNQDMVAINAEIFSQYVDNLRTAYSGEEYEELSKYLYPTKADMENKNVKFILVGHSMGGLISRYYIENMESPCVLKLITLCTPHYGSNLAEFSDDKFPFAFHACDVDLRKDGMLFGGDERGYGKLVFSNIFEEDYAYQNQSDSLKGNRNTQVKYYAVAALNAFDYLEPIDSKEQSSIMAQEMKAQLESGVSFMINVERDETSLKAFKESINKCVSEMSMSRYNKASRLLLKDGDGDTVVDYLSQLAIRFDSEGNFDESQRLEKAKMIITTGYMLPLNMLHTEIADNPLLYAAVKEFIED